jgi:mannose-1-phosphate guanylyltransferase/phosphomannomutase
MKAIVMAGGFGSRLYPFTLNCPKPMLPLINQPVLAHILDLLKRHHIFDVIIATHYLPEQIQAYFGDGRHQAMSLQYSVEKLPLGTAGCVKNAQPYLDDKPFLVISGDIVTDINLAQVVRFHQEKRAVATLALTHVADPAGYGVVSTDQAGRIRQYLEKPSHQSVISNFVNTGIYVLEPKLLDDMKPDTPYDFSYDIFPRLVKQDAALFGCLAEGYWRDMGTARSYQQSIADVGAGKVNLIQAGTNRWATTNGSAKRPSAPLTEALALPIRSLTHQASRNPR